MPTVGWQRDMDVQLGIQVINTDHTLLGLLYGDEQQCLEIGEKLHKWLHEQTGVPWDFRTSDEQNDSYMRFGSEVLAMVEGSRYPQDRDGIWASLTRREINDLIRLLRRARDQAYGRDE
jgi:hypothetical protein